MAVPPLFLYIVKNPKYLLTMCNDNIIILYDNNICQISNRICHREVHYDTM